MTSKYRLASLITTAPRTATLCSATQLNAPQRLVITAKSQNLPHRHAIHFHALCRYAPQLAASHRYSAQRLSEPSRVQCNSALRCAMLLAASQLHATYLQNNRKQRSVAQRPAPQLAASPRSSTQRLFRTETNQSNSASLHCASPRTATRRYAPLLPACQLNASF